MEWFNDLYYRRQQWHEANELNGFQDGIRRLMVDKYADPTHFVYELLQNAEDQNATEASFELEQNRLIFRHNGSGFARRDVENITGVCISQKAEEPNKIGRFGIGFKSVFAVTSRPIIYSKLDQHEFGFAIENLVVPRSVEISDDASDGQTTFVLPLISDQAAGLHGVISERLRTLGADTMLFLRHLSWIEWRDGESSGSYLCLRGEGNLIDLEEQRVDPRGNQAVKKSHYLAFNREVRLDGADRDLQVSIAFRLEDGAIVAESGQTCLNVFFPTRELTHLRFRMHGPFLLNDGRANLRDGTSENPVLIGACADLLVATLPELRDRGLLTSQCLETLPIRPADFEDSVFKPLYDACLRALNSLPLIPTDDGVHMPATRVKLTDSAPLRGLLKTVQLTSLFGSQLEPDETVHWIASDIQKNAAASKDVYDYLFRQVKLDEVDADKFAARVDGPFLEEQSDEWMLSFYELLDNQQALWRPKSGHQSAGVLRFRPIIRTETNAHIPPFRDDGSPRVFMPSGIGAPETTVKGVLANNDSGKSFLTKLGLEPRNSTDEVLEIILPRIQAYDVEACLATYSSFLPNYLHDLEIIRSAIDKCSTQRTGQLRAALLGTSFVLSYNAEDDSCLSLLKPAETMIPSADLAVWFAGNPDSWFVSGDLLEEVSWQKIQSFLNSGKPLILQDLRVISRTAEHDGHVCLADGYGYHKRGLHRFDPDASIPGLTFAIDNINLGRATILWTLLLDSAHLLKGVVEQSSYKTFHKNVSATQGPSALGNACLSGNWLPDKDATWHKPEGFSLEELHPDLESDSPQAETLAAVLGFQNVERREALRQLGFAAEDEWVIRSLAQHPEMFSRIRDELTRMATRAPFPSSNIPNPDRLAEAVQVETESAEAITYEPRTRSVRTSHPVAQDSRTYLQARYTDEDEELRCQVCENAMPFRLDDGTPYFEAVQLLRLVRHELYQNRLALCPVCAAKFRFALGESDEEIYGQFMGLDPQTPTMTVTLARLQGQVRFNPKHLAELQSAVKAVINRESRDSS